MPYKPPAPLLFQAGSQLGKRPKWYDVTFVFILKTKVTPFETSDYVNCDPACSWKGATQTDIVMNT